MKSKAELTVAMAALAFVPDPRTGGYRRGEEWVSSSQAREALAAAEQDTSWTEGDVEPLSETLARQLTKAGIG